MLKNEIDQFYEDLEDHLVQFRCSVMSVSLQPYGLPHARLPCPSSTPRACPNSCPSSWWYQPSHLLSPPSLLAFNLSSISVFSKVHHIKWPNLEFQLQHQSFQWILGLISLRIDWFDSLAVQVTLKSLLQHHSSKHQYFSAQFFFIVQLSHPYMTSGKTIAITRWTFISKTMYLPFNMLSMLVIDFLPRSKHLLISPSAVILEPPKIKCHCFHFFPIYFPWMMGLDAMILVFWMLSVSQLCHSPLSLSSRGSLVLYFLP